MNLKNKTVLVIGAGGFIGSHLTEQLLEKAACVKAFVRYNSKRSCGNLEFLGVKLNNIEIFYGDIRDADVLVKAMQGVDVVFNLAALVGIPYSYVNPHEVAMVNIIGTLNSLAAARSAGVKKFVQTSTSEVYGSPDRVPIRESDTLKPQSPYSATKIGSDSLALSYYYSFGLPVAIIRPFNTYGPRQSARAVIPTVISQALNGSVIKLGSLAPRRDFTYVLDTVSGFIKVAEADCSVGTVINIGTGKDVSVGELVAIIGKILGRKLVVKVDSRRIRPDKSEVVRLMADNSKAKKMLGWSASFSLEQGLRETVGFIAKNRALYDYRQYAV